MHVVVMPVCVMHVVVMPVWLLFLLQGAWRRRELQDAVHCDCMFVHGSRVLHRDEGQQTRVGLRLARFEHGAQCGYEGQDTAEVTAPILHACVCLRAFT
jgi:hypothetical protein